MFTPLSWILSFFFLALPMPCVRRVAAAPDTRCIAGTPGVRGVAAARGLHPVTRHRIPLLSEDFEGGYLDSTRWVTPVNGANTIGVQSGKAAHGKNALLVRCPRASNKTWALLMTRQLPSSLCKHHFGRAYVYLAAPPPIRHTIFIMAGGPGFPNNKYQEVATAQGKWQLTYVDLASKPGYEDWHWGGTLPVGRWFCLEWEFSDQPSHTNLWVDGEAVFGTDFVRKPDGATQDLVGCYSDYAFGFRLWGDALAPFDIYFDDIALDNQRIGR